jgi:hypothetical protein
MALKGTSLPKLLGRNEIKTQREICSLVISKEISIPILSGLYQGNNLRQGNGTTIGYMPQFETNKMSVHAVSSPKPTLYQWKSY